MAYDYKRLESVVMKVKINPNSKDNLAALQKELNECYPDCKCQGVLYTNNTDKMFFGMCVLPIISHDEFRDIVSTNKPVRIKNYYIEIDSKLFDPGAGLTTREITAIILHEVGHLVNDPSPVEKTRHAMDIQYAVTGTTMKFDENDDINTVLIVGITDTLRKVTSLFYRNDEEIMADSYVVKCGYGLELVSALKKISKNGWNLNQTVNNKFVVLAWCLRLYHDFNIRRIAALRSIKKSSELTGSELEKRQLLSLSDRLRSARGGMVRESVCLLEHDRGNNIFYKAKRNSIKKYEEDYFEYVMMARNVTDQDEALWMMREINARISIIENFLATEKNIPEKERDRWDTLFDNYIALRDNLAKTVTYKDRFVGIQVNYPAIKGMDY